MIIGFASGIEAEELPWVTPQAVLRNFSLGGVLLSYGESPPIGYGTNMTPYSVGLQVQERLVEMLRAGQIRPLVTETYDYAKLPEALLRMEDRSTVGRVVVDFASGS